MMSKAAAIAKYLMFVFVVACSASALPTMRQDRWEWTDDADARRVRETMEHAVKIEVSYTYDVPQDIIDTYGLTPDDLRSGSMGSGAVVGVDGDSSLVMTAGHVCDASAIETIIGTFRTKDLRIEVIDLDGNRHEAVVLVQDYDIASGHDVCVLDVVGVAGVPARLADAPPPVGGVLSTAGAPRGRFGRDRVFYREGWYIGSANDFAENGADIEDERSWYMSFSLDGVQGSSGSGIFYGGRLVSVMTLVEPSFTSQTWGPSFWIVRDAYEKAYVIWQDR